MNFANKYMKHDYRGYLLRVEKTANLRNRDVMAMFEKYCRLRGFGTTGNHYLVSFMLPEDAKRAFFALQNCFKFCEHPDFDNDATYHDTNKSGNTNESKAQHTREDYSDNPSDNLERLSARSSPDTYCSSTDSRNMNQALRLPMSRSKTLNFGEFDEKANGGTTRADGDADNDSENSKCRVRDNKANHNTPKSASTARMENTDRARATCYGFNSGTPLKNLLHKIKEKVAAKRLDGVKDFAQPGRGLASYARESNGNIGHLREALEPGQTQNQKILYAGKLRAIESFPNQFVKRLNLGSVATKTHALDECDSSGYASSQYGDNDEFLDGATLPNLVNRKCLLIKQPVIQEAHELVVGNVPSNVSPSYILYLFEEYEPLAISHMKTAPTTNLRFCHVYFKEKRDTLALERKYDNCEIGGKNLLVLQSHKLRQMAASN